MALQRLRSCLMQILDLVLETDKQAAVTRRNQKKSPFLRLPSELRNLIYSFALETSNVYVSNSYKRGDEFPLEVGLMGILHLRMNDRNEDLKVLMKVCRQIRNETALIPVPINTYYGNLDRLFDFLSGLTTAQRAQIRALQVTFDGLTGGSFNRVFYRSQESKTTMQRLSDLTRDMVGLEYVQCIRRCERMDEIKGHMKNWHLLEHVQVDYRG